ncbi:hypothetical protein [Halodesulfovibrio sp. MK-HDV]|jgi:hypothetical protein|uniref:hypothetical protein n=1 Tax=Halodesulfovibrio sp. MK-HDV TaxID=2599925 RepID=UPI00137110D1|nr:hypothetical protein [Halodesulfovibrio sp. MK-HDV]KAF1073424.1 hypothetical protein MKHDV_03621 [Halodesulfovibrio sp. MK-HDV]
MNEAKLQHVTSVKINGSEIPIQQGSLQVVFGKQNRGLSCDSSELNLVRDESECSFCSFEAKKSIPHVSHPVYLEFKTENENTRINCCTYRDDEQRWICGGWDKFPNTPKTS